MMWLAWTGWALASGGAEPHMWERCVEEELLSEADHDLMRQTLIRHPPGSAVLMSSLDAVIERNRSCPALWMARAGVHHAEGRKEEVQNEIFVVASYLLRPGGRLFITCIHCKEYTDPDQVMQPVLNHPVGSYLFYCRILVDLYSGWYPDIGDYERAGLNNNLVKVFERDATEDYYITSRLWGRKLRQYLKENKRFRNRFLRKLFWNDPRYFFTAFLYYYYDAWTWQFRPAPQSPMYHRWLMFEKKEGH